MLDYLKKFNNLPKDIREKISSERVMKEISKLEEKFGLNLATVIMRVMVKDISILDLSKYFVFEYGLDGKQAERLVDELKDKVFADVYEYLGDIKAKVLEEGGSLDDWMEQRKNEASVRSSNFFFSAEDEEEVNELAKKVNEFAPREYKKKKNTEEEINEIVKTANINFGSEDLQNRFKQVLKSYLRGIRNRLETKETLTKGLEIGGLGFDPISVDEVMAIVERTAGKYENGLGVNFTEESSASVSGSAAGVSAGVDFAALGGGRDVDYDFSRFAKKEESAEVDSGELIMTPEEENIINPQEVAAAEERPVIKSAAGPGIKEPAPKKTENVAVNLADKEKPVIPEISAITKRREASAGRIKMEDVKRAPKLTGPIEELAEMDIINFRRLSRDSREAAGKIKEKLAFLEGDGYARRLEGIKAWRRSPINAMYLKIGEESINANKPIENTIREKTSSGQDCLTILEFEAIMELNRETRF